MFDESGRGLVEYTCFEYRATRTPPGPIVVASLLRMGKALPGKRKGLERHIDNHLGRKGDMDAARALVDELERDGLLRIVDNKVEYTLPKASK